MDDLIPRVAVLEQIARDTQAALIRIEARFDGIDRRFDGVERRLDGMERRLDRIETRIDTIEARRHSDFKWVVGLMMTGFGGTIAGFVTLLGVMAHSFKWI